MRLTVGRLVGAAALLVLSAPVADAQIEQRVGVRAQGMAGAFTAVADDSTATWWNPAGLAGGAYFDGLVEFDAAQEPRADHDAQGLALPGWNSRVRGLAVAFPALGLSYYHLQFTEIHPLGPIVPAVPGRQDEGPGELCLTTLRVSQFGATVGQSIGDHFVAAATVKLLRGSVASATGVEVSLERPAESEGPTETRGDADAGFMATFGVVRIGATLRNLTAPGFSLPSAAEFVVRRQARAGVAVAVPAAGLDALTVAVDSDLTVTPSAMGDQRHVAAGVEAWTVGRRVGVRGGASANTVGDLRPAVSGGLSVAVGRRLYAEGAVTAGSEQAGSGWGFALRVTF